MFKSYFRIAWRGLGKNKGYSSINIIGLAIGMAIAGLIALWVADEISFDSYFKNHRRIVQGMVKESANGQTYSGTVVSVPLGRALQTQFADRFEKIASTSFPEEHLFSVGEKKLLATGLWTEHPFPSMFTLRMISGDIDALKDPSTLLINKSFAASLFGNENPVNKTVRLDNNFEMKVGGVYEDLPHNTSFYNTKFLLPWESQQNAYRNKNTNWDDHNGFLFAELKDKQTTAGISAQIKTLPTPYIKDIHEEAMVEPLDKLHLYYEPYGANNDVGTGGFIQFVRLFGIIGVFVLLLACINFMNLSTARSEKRAKEVGIRKTIGSMRSQLVGQFLSESTLVALLAAAVAIAAMALALPLFNTLSGKEIVFPWTSPLFWLLAVGFALFTGLISGSYPAFYLSGFEPIKVLKGTFRAARNASLPRQILVVLQFTVSVILIIGTIIVYRQIQFAKDRPVGYNRAGLITVKINTPELGKHYDDIRNDLLQSGSIAEMSESSQAVTNFGNNNALEWRGKRPEQNSIMFYNVNVSREFGKTVGWTILQGRDFSRSMLTDSNSIILSDTAAKIVGFANPIGENVSFFGKRYTIIGVAKNMLTNSPFRSVSPSIFLGDGFFTVITIRLRPELSVKKALADVETVFRKYDPASPFVYSFSDDEFAAKFKTEERIGHLSTIFAVFAIFISCLGLFGLASFVAEQRTKEIGVRKVLGANLLTLWGLLSKDFAKLVFLSFFISMPVAYWQMDKWLSNYAYQTTMPWWIFAGAGIGILLITLLTVSYQSLKAALRNPVKSLRSE